MIKVSNNNVNLYIPTNLQVVTGYTDLRVSFNTILGTNFTGNIIGGVGISSSSSPIVFSGLTTGTAYSMYVTNLFNDTLIKSKTLTVSTASYPIITNAPASTSIVLTITNPTANTTYSGNTTTGIQGVATGSIITVSSLTSSTAYTINVYSNINGFFTILPSINVSTILTISLTSYTATLTQGNTTNFNYVQVNSSGNVTFGINSGKLFYVLVGGGGGGGAQYFLIGTITGTLYRGGGGGGVIDGSYNTTGNTTFSIIIGVGGAGARNTTGGGNGNDGGDTIMTATDLSIKANKGSGGAGNTNPFYGSSGSQTLTLAQLTSTDGSNGFFSDYLGSDVSGINLTLDTTIFKLCGGGGSGSGSTAPIGQSLYGGGYGNFNRNASNGLANSGGGGGGVKATSGGPFYGGNGGSGCVFFFWAK
jgi:hypothetical protein